MRSFPLIEIPSLVPVQSSADKEGHHDRECDKRLGFEGLDGNAGDELERVKGGKPRGNRRDLLHIGDDERRSEEKPNKGSQGRQHSDKEGGNSSESQIAGR